MTDLPTLSPAQEALLQAAERLLAEKGLGAVSTREIAREAGQKNHSAVNYHFGSMDGLIEAVLDYRMVPLNERRRAMLEELTATGRENDLRALVEIVVEPLANELLRPAEESGYLRLLAQLMSVGEWQSLFTVHPHRSSVLLESGAYLQSVMQQTLPDDIVFERLRLLGLHAINAVTEWDGMGRRGELTLTRENLSWRVTNLIDYLAAALVAEHHKSN
ncbi:MAG: helix-turn-helix domain-containing protein [Halioglobus sp.]